MRDREFRAQQGRVKLLIKKWVAPLGFGWQRITFRWFDEPIPDHQNALMTCTPQWEYHQAIIRVCVPQVGEVDDDELERAFVHELMHVVLAGMWATRDTDDDKVKRLMEEHTATVLAKIVIWARAAGQVDPRTTSSKKAT